MTQPIGDWSRRVGAAAGLIGAACVAAIVIFALSDIGGGGAAQSWASPTIGLAAVGAAVAGFLLVNRASGSAVLFALVCGVLAHASMVGVARSLEPLWIGPRLATTIDRAGIDPRDGRVAGPVAMAGYSEPSAIFLLGTQTELGDGAMAARAVAEGRPAAVEGRQQASFLAEMARLRIRPYAVGVVEGRNYSNGDETRLTLYRPVPPVTTSAQ
jgi:hypothetical protein